MSRDLFLTCETCKQRIHIGQGQRSFYYGEEKTMKALGKFLFLHETKSYTADHNLRFIEENDDWYVNDKGWIEIDIDTYILDLDN